MITLSIDNKEVEIEDGATILEAAQKAGVEIPTLCYDKRLTPFGACRICLVEVEGTRTKFTPSCTTPATQGMKIKTISEDIIHARRTILELLLINHPLDCPVCDKSGECKLQDMVYEYGLSEVRFKGSKSDLPVDHRSPLIERNMNRCILCGKCTRICDEVMNVAETSFINRGIRTQIGTDFARPLNCAFCGQCIDICPVGALTSKLFKYKARLWELVNIDIICSFCNVGCSLMARSKNGKILKIEARENGVNEGGVCVKGHFGFDYIYSNQRLTTPLVKKDGKLQETSWEEAIELVATQFLKLNGKMAAFISSRLTNEEIYLTKRFMHDILKSPHIAHSQDPGGFLAMKETGILLGSMKDIRNSDCIFLVGSDISETNPVAENAVNQAVKKNGASLIVINSKMIKSSKIASWQLITSPGQEITVINGVISFIIKENLFSLNLGENFNEMKKLATKYTLNYTEERAGVGKDLISACAKRFLESKNPCIILSNPASNLVKAVSSLLFLKGKTSLILLGSRCNEQGAFDILGHGIPQEELLNSDRIKGLFILGCNPATYAEDTLKKKEFLVVSDLFLTKTAELADVVLPAASALEKNGTYTNFEGRLQRTNIASSPPNGVKSDLEIISKIISKMSQEPIEVSIDEVYPDLKEGERKEETLKKVKFSPVESEEIRRDKDYPFFLLLGTSKFHSGKISSYSNSLMELCPEPILSMNSTDKEKLKIGEQTKIITSFGSITVRCKIDQNLPVGNCFLLTHPKIDIMELSKQKYPIRARIEQEEERE